VFVVYLPILQKEILLFAGHPIKVYHVLWYLFSFGGVAAVCLAYANWRRKAISTSCVGICRPNWAQAVLIAAFVLPLGAVHHLFHDLIGMLVVAILTVLLFTIAAQRLGSSP
jgi:hypothetical protein